MLRDMSAEKKPALVALRDRREEVIESLCEAYAVDTLEESEFERRLDIAHKADTVQALEKLVTDIVPAEPGASSKALAVVSEEQRAIAKNRPKSKNVVAILGGAERKGSWRVPKKTNVWSILGGSLLDFRDVVLPPGETEVRVHALLGGVEIIVPPNLAVDCEGIGIMGGFENLDRVALAPDETTPVLRITGFAFMGGCEIKTRLPGETAREARKRKKRERRRRRKELRSGNLDQ
jgi:hypothetical protein